VNYDIRDNSYFDADVYVAPAINLPRNPSIVGAAAQSRVVPPAAGQHAGYNRNGGGLGSLGNGGGLDYAAVQQTLRDVYSLLGYHRHQSRPAGPPHHRQGSGAAGQQQWPPHTMGATPQGSSYGHYPRH
jgi:hypothetical protein